MLDSTSKRAIGHVDSRVGQILEILAADGELALQLGLSACPIAAEPVTKPSRVATHYLRIVIYGPRHRLGDVGYFVTQCSLYLEDPVGCDRNVPYMNPQCLFSFHEHLTMTFDLPQLLRQTFGGFTRTSSDILSEFETTDSIEESSDPKALRTSLQPYVRETSKKRCANFGQHRHQRQALTFFLRRERGLHPSEDGFGIWSRQSREGKAT